jgi:adenylate cyclase
MGRIARFFRVERILGLAIIAGAIVVWGKNAFPLPRLQAAAFDLFQQLKPRERTAREDGPIVIIGIDEASLRQYGQWPWSRVLMARIVDVLAAARAKVIAFDVVFAEPDRIPVAGVRGSDEIFHAAIGRGRVVLGMAATDEIDPEARAPPAPKFKIAERGPNLRRFVPSFSRLVPNLPTLEGPARGIGLVSLSVDTDGVIRHVPTVYTHGGNLYPGFGLEVLRVALGAPSILLQAHAEGIGIAHLGIAPNLFVPTDASGRAWVHFARPDAFPRMSAADVIQGNISPEAIAGKIAIVGATAVGLGDIKQTPLGEPIPGVLVHAEFVESALENRLLKRLAYFNAVELVTIVVTGLVAIVLLPALSARWAIAVFLALEAALAGASWYAFAIERMLLDAVPAMLVLVVLYVIATAARSIRMEDGRAITPG